MKPTHKYYGPNSTFAWYAEPVQIIAILPHGTHYDQNGKLYPPEPFQPHMSRYIGEWATVENQDGERADVPKSWLEQIKA